MRVCIVSVLVACLAACSSGGGKPDAGNDAGDQVTLDVRTGPYMSSCLAAGETNCLFLTGAQVQMGSFQQSVDDRLRLVYVGSHHNWYDEYLILLDPPAGDTQAIWIDAPDFMGNTGYLIKLDAGFNEVSKDEITDWQQS
jgi:hypothetical protein